MPVGAIRIQMGTLLSGLRILHHSCPANSAPLVFEGLAHVGEFDVRRRFALSSHTLFRNKRSRQDAPVNSHNNPPPPYRFGFVLTTAAGNSTRFRNLRKYVERDPEIEAIWAPVTHWLDPDPFQRWPRPIRSRMVVARQAQPVMRCLRALDAVMFHAFEPYAWACLRSLALTTPAIVWSQDNPPAMARNDHPQTEYGVEYSRSPGRAKLRLALDRFCLSRTAVCVPFSRWAGNVLTESCGIPAHRVHPIHTGLDLEVWLLVQPEPPHESRRTKLLFVGGDFKRKGGDILFDLFCKQFRDRAELHIVTHSPVGAVPPEVTVYSQLDGQTPALRALYAACDLFVLPTRADMSSWAALEAMATGRPVIATNLGGIPDIVDDGITGFLVQNGDISTLAQRLQQLIDSPDLRRNMGIAGRRRVEQLFDASVNVPRIMNAIKQVVNERRKPTALPKADRRLV